MGRLYKIAVQESETLFANCLKEKRELKEYYKKIGGKLVGLHLSAFAYEEDAAVFENNHLDEITDRMKIQAAKLGVDPRKIISRVLKYKLRIIAENSKE